MQHVSGPVHTYPEIFVSQIFLCGSDAQWWIAQSIISLNWNKFLFTCFKEVPVKSIAKITQRYIVIRELIYTTSYLLYYPSYLMSRCLRNWLTFMRRNLWNLNFKWPLNSWEISSYVSLDFFDNIFYDWFQQMFT